MPAGADRHGVQQRAEPDRRRRADHRAGRGHPIPRHAAAEGAAGAARRRRAADHPRPASGRRAVRPGWRDVCRRHGRARAGRVRPAHPGASLHPGPAQQRAGPARADADAAVAARPDARRRRAVPAARLPLRTALPGARRRLCRIAAALARCGPGPPRALRHRLHRRGRTRPGGRPVPHGSGHGGGAAGARPGGRVPALSGPPAPIRAARRRGGRRAGRLAPGGGGGVRGPGRGKRQRQELGRPAGHGPGTADLRPDQAQRRSAARRRPARPGPVRVPGPAIRAQSPAHRAEPGDAGAGGRGPPRHPGGAAAEGGGAAARHRPAAGLHAARPIAAVGRPEAAG